MTRNEAISKAAAARDNGATYPEISSDLYRQGFKSPRGGKYSAPGIKKLIDQARRAEPPVAAATLVPSRAKPGAKVIAAIRAILEIDLGESLQVNMIAALFEG